MNRRPAVLFLEHPSPHNQELVSALQRSLPGSPITVWVRRTDDDERGWMKGDAPRQHVVAGSAVSVWRNVLQLKPAASILFGYRQREFLAAILAARVARSHILIRLDVSHSDDTALPALKRLLRHRALRLLLGRRATALAIGRSNARFWTDVGVPHIALVPYAPATWHQAATPPPYEGVTALTVSRLSAEKGVLWAIRALAGAEDLKGHRWRWLVIGAGPQRDSIANAVSSSWLSEHVELVGPVPHSELAGYYSVADFLVVPSFREAWGMVAAEGARAGCRLLLSDRIPSIEDLDPSPRDDVFPSRDRPQFRSAFRRQVRLGAEEDRSCRYAMTSSDTGELLARVLTPILS